MGLCDEKEAVFAGIPVLTMLFLAAGYFILFLPEKRLTKAPGIWPLRVVMAVFLFVLLYNKDNLTFMGLDIRC
jgi:hypothetical protein